jgi:hypothetical protein
VSELAEGDERSFLIESTHEGKGRRVQPAIVEHNPDEMTVGDVQPSVVITELFSARRRCTAQCGTHVFFSQVILKFSSELLNWKRVGLSISSESAYGDWDVLTPSRYFCGHERSSAWAAPRKQDC